MTTAIDKKILTHASNIIELTTQGQILMAEATRETDILYNAGYVVRGTTADNLNQADVIITIAAVQAAVQAELSKIPPIRQSAFTDELIAGFGGTAHLATSVNLYALMDALVFQHILNQINKPVMSASVLPLQGL